MDAITLLSLIVFFPCVGAVILLFIPKEQSETLRLTTLATTVVVLLLSLWMLVPESQAAKDAEAAKLGQSPVLVEQAIGFAPQTAEMQNVVSAPWIPSFKIEYFLGIDGISFPLVVLTAFLFVVAMWASWPIEKNVKTYCILFLILETGVLGVFVSLDFFLFFVFWEVMLLPMYFLIGVWGGPRREYAAIKFFLYTFAGGVMMLVAILMLYFNSDLNELNDQQLVDANVVSRYLSDADRASAIQEIRGRPERGESTHTFNILALQQMGQKTGLFDGEVLAGKSIQWWAFLLLFIGFAIKVPSVPVHTWLPDAHVEAPTPISMILAGILLKLGGYGIIRICYPICPAGGYELMSFVVFIGVLSIIYGAFAAMAQKDFKRLVAYSSVSHMGYVVLGMGVWTAVAGQEYASDYWKLGMNGAMYQMIAHGLSSAGMFFMVGVVYERVHHRNLDEFGGLFAKMPVYSGLALAIFFAGLGLPGLCGFIGEIFVVLSVWNHSIPLAILTASAVILTAGYILWTLQRVYLGAEYKGPHPEALTDVSPREIGIAAPLVIGCVLFGVYPDLLLRYMEPSVSNQVQELAVYAQEKELGTEIETAAAPSELPNVAAEQAPEAPAAEQQDVTTPDESTVLVEPADRPQVAAAGTLP